ncbi:hypothetical protein C8F01DRAFT_1325563 [Mycena amicta]|nr:hypothetical protein C8F01DRAFT_1325563 [Mycena amicta]
MESGSIFQKAFHEYVSSLPEKKKTRKRKFIVDCTATRDGRPTTPETINEALRQAEIQNADKPGRKMIKKVMGPIVNALRDYDGIINSLASADPMPTAIIWGALKVILDGAHRFFNLFDTIKKELRVLQVQIQRISEYETLYGDSAMLQDLLCRSYINMFRFWSRVDKECESYWYMGMLKAATSFSTKKLDSIIKDIEENADQIEELASILEANKGKGEREAADIERFRQGMERAAAQKERDAAAAERGENQVVRQEERYRRICEWLCARQGNEDNMRHLRLLTSHHMQGTCEWLLQHQTYIDWCAGTASPVLWIYAPPAAGKSVLSSHIIHATSRSDGDAIVVYHFYRFDQMHTASETLRILAGQLFDAYWARNHTVSDDMFSKAQQSVCSTENVQELIKLLVRDLPKTYFILDGVDEECTSVTRWLEATTTLQFLLKLTVDVPGRMRVWYSSQPRQLIYDLLKAACTMIDAQSHAEADIARYLCHDNPELRDLEVSDADKDHVLASLQSRAKANFLWASRMLWSLKKRDSLTDMKQFVAEGLPKTLDEYYGRIFDNFDRSHRERSLISLRACSIRTTALRLVKFARQSACYLAKILVHWLADDMPLVSRLRTLLPPLIEFQEDGCSDPDDCTCRLFHSTVREFLVKTTNMSSKLDYPMALLTRFLIAPKVIANACLRYLCQERYSRPLRKHDIRG